MCAAAVPDSTTAMPEPGTADASAPFGRETVTLTKQAHIELISQARYWKSAHERAVIRADWVARGHQHEMDLARLRESAVRAELELALAQVRDLRQRVFGIKTEQSRLVVPTVVETGVRRPRGQQRGRPGHGQRRSPELPSRVEDIVLDTVCPQCGLGLREFPGVEEREVVEFEVRAYKRVIRRQRYRPSCRCGCLAGVLCAAPPAQLFARGKLGVSVWVNALLSKFLYGQPTHRLLQDWAEQGLKIAQGTLTDGLRRLAPLFEPLVEAGLAQLRTHSHWHADETRWEVFVEREGKVGHRWYLWVFQSANVVHYTVDPSRSAQVPMAALEGVSSGILSVDRYAAYKKFARQSGGISLSYCWAHQRRDFLNLARDHPSLWNWAMQWVQQIAGLYRLHELRCKAFGLKHSDAGKDQHIASEPELFARYDRHVREAVQAMQRQCEEGLANAQLASAARKVLTSLKSHWTGLVVFVDHPSVGSGQQCGRASLAHCGGGAQEL